ncbi:MAG: hypothetical protein FWH41_04485 [Treponema sp.]|nr:hypothetical protein [Treponema sp.]
MKLKQFLILCTGLMLVYFLFTCKSQQNSINKYPSLSIESLAKKTVFLDITMDKWQKAVLPLLDAGIYNAALETVIEEYYVQEKQRAVLLKEQLAEYYAGLYNTEFAFDSYPLEDDKFNINFFHKPDEQTRTTISEICAKHEAEYVIALAGQMGTIKVNIFGINGQNGLYFHMAIFDKSGGTVFEGGRNSGFVTMKAKDVPAFISMFDKEAEALKSMIKLIGQ